MTAVTDARTHPDPISVFRYPYEQQPLAQSLVQLCLDSLTVARKFDSLYCVLFMLVCLLTGRQAGLEQRREDLAPAVFALTLFAANIVVLLSALVCGESTDTILAGTGPGILNPSFIQRCS